MERHEIYAIDARMIDTSGIGTYIRMVMRSGIYKVALGDEETIHRYFPNIYVIQFNEKIYGIKEQLRFPVRRLKRAGVTVLHSPHYNVPVFWNRELRVTIHDLIHIKFPEYLPNKMAYIYAKLMLQFDCWRAKRIFTVSEYTKKDIIENFHVNKDKIKITYNTVEDCFTMETTEKTQYLYEKYNFSHDNKIILYVGNIKPHKNVKMIVESFRALNDMTSRLILVGRAFDDDVRKKFGIDNEIADRVILTGEVEQQEVVDWYNLADVFVFPSLYEGFGVPPLEAMACGTPVICSNMASIPEVVGDSAIIVNPKSVNELCEAIRSIFTMSKTEKRNIVEKGKKRVEYFRKIETQCKRILQN